MKKIILLFVAAIMVLAVTAQERKVVELKKEQLPKTTQKYIADNFPGGTVARAGKVDDKGVVSYVVVIDTKGRKHSYVFDKDGNFQGKGDKMVPPPPPAGAKQATGATQTDPKQSTKPATQPASKTTTKPAATEEAPKK